MYYYNGKTFVIILFGTTKMDFLLNVGFTEAQALEIMNRPVEVEPKIIIEEAVRLSDTYPFRQKIEDLRSIRIKRK